MLQNLAPYVSDRFHALARQPAIARTYFPRILRAIQLAAHDYFHGVSANVADSVVGVPVPDLASLFQERKRGTLHQSTNWIDLPDSYMEPLPSPPVPAVNAPAPSGSTVATQASTRTGVSTITQDASSRTTVTRVDNPTNNTEFTGITFRPGGARAVLRTHCPPANEAGHKFCVAWWTRGGGVLSKLRTQRHSSSVCIARRTHASAGLRAGAPASPGVRCQRLTGSPG